MARDLDATRITLNYAKGAVTLTRGLAKALFGPTYGSIADPGAAKTIDVKSHTRVRVIGGPGKAVAAHSYTIRKFPTMDSGGAQGGQVVTVVLASGERWSVRVSGSMAEFCLFMGSKLSAAGVQFISERGTIYGPFGLQATLAS